VVELSGPIGPAMSLYFERSLAAAGNDRSAVVILQMDTPGGLDTSMRDIIKAILASSGACGGLRCAERSAGGQCRHLHSLCEPSRRHGPGDQSGRSDTDFDRR